jgi:metal-dependent amidase/aminoacylase/carboxypeptidase family protein
VQGLQSLVSRALDPLEPAVLSITQFHGGETTNVIPSTVTLEGTARTYTSHAQAVLEAGIARLAAGTAASYGLDIAVQYQHGYPATINTPREAAFARSVLEALAGQERVLSRQPLMTAEDFSFMLQARPGAYIWVGNGDSAGLHTPHYNFNDDILTLGAAYWVRLVEATPEENETWVAA